MSADPAEMSDLMHSLEVVEVDPGKPVDLAASARYYATVLRWPIFPLKPRSKVPATEHGLKDATDDPLQVAKWWQRIPDANIGIRTGTKASGGCEYDVVDIDGTPGFASLEILRPSLPRIHAISFTPGDPVKRPSPGRHLYIEATGDGNGAGIMDGIDYRGVGGYVVAPPSVLLQGVRYSWIEAPR